MEEEKDTNYLPLTGDGGNDVANPSLPISQFTWKPPSKIEKLVANGITITIRLAPTAIIIWLFAPDHVKYTAMKYSRYIPWAVKYAVWWLNQKEL